MIFCRHTNVSWPQKGIQCCLDCGRVRPYAIGQRPGKWQNEKTLKEKTMQEKLHKPSAIVAITFWLLLLGIAITSITLGCAAKQSIHPGAINTFDSQAADDLLLVQTTLCGTNSTTTTCPGGLNAELSSHPTLLPALQAATKSYNAALALYTAWAKTATAGATAPANVQSAITQAKTDAATAQRTLTGGKL